MSENSWANRTIRECLIASFAGEWGAEATPGNARVLRATDIDDDGHVVGSGVSRRIPISKLNSRRLEDGDVLVEGSGGGPGKPVGRVALFEVNQHREPAICSNFFKTLRANRSVVEPRFLWRKLAWFYSQPTLLVFQQQTTGIINLKFEEYLNATIDTPIDLSEQRLIAGILDTLDTAIRETEAIIDKLKAVKQGLLHDLLTRGIDANGELRPPQSEAPHLYKQSPLGSIPIDWDVANVGGLISELGQGWSPDCLVEVASVGEWGVLKTTAIVWSGYDDKENKKMPSLLKARPELEVQQGDILITRAGPKNRVGVVVYVAHTQSKLMISDKMYRLRLVGTEVPAYVALALSSRYAQEAISRSVCGMAESQTNITQVVISELQILRPSALEQAAIVARVESFDAKVLAEVGLLGKMKKQKIGLMDDLLTGRVRVTPLLDS